jgi:hypothetical protein
MLHVWLPSVAPRISRGAGPWSSNISNGKIGSIGQIIDGNELSIVTTNKPQKNRIGQGIRQILNGNKMLTDTDRAQYKCPRLQVGSIKTIYM